MRETRQRFPFEIDAMVVLPDHIHAIVDCNGEAPIARLTRCSVERLGLRPGPPVFALAKSASLDRRSLSGPFQATAANPPDEAGDP